MNRYLPFLLLTSMMVSGCVGEATDPPDTASTPDTVTADTGNDLALVDTTADTQPADTTLSDVPLDTAVPDLPLDTTVPDLPFDTTIPYDTAVPDTSTADTVTPETVEDVVDPFKLEIFVTGDVTARTFNDGFAGQTPRNYTLGLVRFDLMKSETDGAPVTIFDHGDNEVEVDMLSTTLVGEASILDITPGVYTHGRALLSTARFDIDARVHVPIVSPLSGVMSVVTALSAWEIDGATRSPGWARCTFNVGMEITKETTLPVMPSSGGGTVVQDNDQTWLVFPLSDNLTILPIPGSGNTATITYDVFESFRWEDLSNSGYQVGAFDVEQSSETFEPIRNFGATGYQVDVN